MTEPIVDPVAIELAMLRDFYTKWARLHSIPRDRLHRNKQEMAAQEMVDAAHVLANFYKMHQEPAKPVLELVHG